MNKQEALIAMEEGKKVSHMYFTPEEWVTIDNGDFLFEDGVRCTFEEFWAYRSDEYWTTDWRLWE